MSNKLGGKQGTAYLGTNADQPPNWVFAVKDPTQYDVNNVSLGDLWLNQTNENVWVLVSLKGIPGSHGSLATWAKLESGGLPSLSTLTANSGGVVHSDVSGNINIVGDGIGINIVGNPATHTLTASLIGGGSFADAFATDSGIAVPSGGVITIKAGTLTQNSGSSVEFTGSGSTVELNVSDASGNTMIGLDAGNGTMTGDHNVSLGTNSGTSLTSGSDNTFVGFQAGNFVGSGSNNVIIGNTSGSAYTNAESNNILIDSPGVTGDMNVIRIGNGTGTGPGQINETFISGILGKTPATADGIPLFIGSNGQLGTVGNGGTTLVSTLTGNTGGAVGPLAGNINIVGDGTTIEITGNPGTNTLTVVGLGGGGGTLSQLSGDTGFALPTAGIIDVIGGVATLHNGSSVSFSGATNVLTLNLSDANDNTIIGRGAGNATISGSDNIAFGRLAAISLTSGSNNIIIGHSAGGSLAVGVSNILIGESAGAALASGSSNNVMIGNLAGGSALNSSENVFIGFSSGDSINTGNYNVFVGSHTGSNITTGTNNTFCGDTVGGSPSFTGGSDNTFIGADTGSAYTSTESNNILLGTATTGVLGEVHTLHIGAGTGVGTGQLQQAFISGIRGVTPSTSDGIPVFIGSTGQLGTVGNGGTSLISKLTGNSGGAVAPTAGNINVVGDGVSVNVVGTPGTSTLTISAVGGAGGPGFLAYMTTDYTTINITIAATVPYDTVAYNQGSDFNLGTSTFTAPVTGVYNFSCNLLLVLNQISSALTILQLVTSSKVFQLTPSKWAGTSGYTSLEIGNNIYTNMTAGDTALITIVGNYSTFTAPVIKGISTIAPSLVPGINTYFSGTLV